MKKLKATPVNPPSTEQFLELLKVTQADLEAEDLAPIKLSEIIEKSIAEAPDPMVVINRLPRDLREEFLAKQAKYASISGKNSALVVMLISKGLYSIMKAPSVSPTERPKGLLVDLLLPPADAENAIYCILGRYDYWVSQHGPAWARVCFFTQSVGSVISFWTSWLMKRLKLLQFMRPS